MEYEFSQDVIGQPVAQFSMGHEAFAFWLEDEVATTAKARHLLERLTTVEGAAIVLEGREYSLRLEGDEACVKANSLLADDFAMDWDTADLSEAAIMLSDEGQQASCGLDDFQQMLEQWQAWLHSIGY